MVAEIIKSRRSIRAFKETPVTKEQIKSLLEAAMRAPSACNTRPWEFIAITKRETLNKLADAHNWAKMLYKAPVAIVMIALPDTQESVQDGIAEGYFPQDCGAATENILIQAEELGLGSCWCGVYPKEPLIKAVRGALDLGEDVLPFCIIAIGEKDEFPGERGSYEESKVTWIE